ncbi:MAG TPA: sodium:proton antiporter [Casimicrobiaceae bacterium]|jgi:Na+/H+ antiporter NhaD/arsenite permease-like protein|nr:sodium:proton antiporter [Casimicrobiaceae bacterium]
MKFATAALLLLLPCSGSAAEFNGAQLGIAWSVPFLGILLSIALCPLLVPSFWHHHFGKVSAGWALAFLVPFVLQYGLGEAVHQTAHTLLLEYIPFILVLFALYTVAGGIRVLGSLHGSPGVNTILLALGTVLASWMGTTGAAMLMIQPVIRANDNRKHKVHVIVFFIILVANAGGALTPLGDPPLFLGFLKGVDFFWTTTHLLTPTLVVCGLLLIEFYALDYYYYHHRGEERQPILDPTPDRPIRVEGAINLLLLGAIIGAVLLSGFWRPEIKWTLLGSEIELQNVMRDVLIVAIALLSLKITPKSTRHGNHFTWGPIVEVAKLFVGIFLTIIPVIAMLRSGMKGVLGPIVRLVTDDNGQPINGMYFWLSGGLSSFLDNAPTYLVFFNMAGGDPDLLMGTLATTLTAISAGSVYMGAMTYIGNAPNFMVKAIAEHRNIKMPSFFGYMGWSSVLLLPTFVVVTLLFFR